MAGRRMPPNEWVPLWREVINRGSMDNMVVFQGGGGLEVAGALQAVADLMLQSVTVPGPSGATYMQLFPLNATFSDLQFHRLRAKGAFVVSAAWNARTARLDGPVTIESEVGGRCTVALPPGDDATPTVSSGVGAPVSVTRDGPHWWFDTRPGLTYTLIAAHR